MQKKRETGREGERESIKSAHLYPSKNGIFILKIYCDEARNRMVERARRFLEAHIRVRRRGASTQQGGSKHAKYPRKIRFYRQTRRGYRSVVERRDGKQLVDRTGSTKLLRLLTPNRSKERDQTRTSILEKLTF